MKRSITVATLETPKPDETIEVEVSYFSRAYWLIARLYTDIGYMRTVDLFRGTAVQRLEDASRFSPKRLEALASKQTGLPVSHIADQLKEKNGITV